MVEWYDMPGALDDFESHPAYLEKLAVDANAEVTTDVIPASEKTTDHSDCSWVKKREHKKKMVRRFLTINPDMDYSKLCGMRCSPAIYLCFPSYNDGDYYDPKMTYSFNPYTRVFLSLRGDLRKYHGAAFPIRGSYALGSKDKDAAKITNRRIRRHALDEDMSSSYSYCKKLYGPLIDEIW